MGAGTKTGNGLEEREKAKQAILLRLENSFLLSFLYVKQIFKTATVAIRNSEAGVWIQAIARKSRAALRAGRMRERKGVWRRASQAENSEAALAIDRGEDEGWRAIAADNFPGKRRVPRGPRASGASEGGGSMEAGSRGDAEERAARQWPAKRMEAVRPFLAITDDMFLGDAS